MKNYSEIKSRFAKSESDTGSVEVQVVDISKRIDEIVKHLDVNKKDFSSKRGLLNLVNKRRTFLDYIKKENVARYQDMIAALELRK